MVRLWVFLKISALTSCFPDGLVHGECFTTLENKLWLSSFFVLSAVTPLQMLCDSV